MTLVDEDYSWLDNTDGGDNTLRKCRHCKWSGKQGDCKRERVNSSPDAWMALAGREGIEYHCPRCGWMVHSFYWKMS